MSGTRFLHQHALFGGLSEEDLDHIRPLLIPGDFPPGADIVREGELGDRLYFLAQGSVEILRGLSGPADPQRHRLATLHAGDTFGEMELIDVQARSATVRALEPVSTLQLTHRGLYSLYQKFPDLYTRLLLNLAREISRRLRRMDALLAASSPPFPPPNPPPPPAP